MGCKKVRNCWCDGDDRRSCENWLTPYEEVKEVQKKNSEDMAKKWAEIMAETDRRVDALYTKGPYTAPGVPGDEYSYIDADPKSGQVEIKKIGGNGPLPSITTDKQKRKEMPVVRGLLDYFPLAVLSVANCSFVGNQQHNPGEALHWAREKSTDQADCAVRHLMERGKRDTDGVRHSAKAAWRALAILQLEIEADGGDI